MALSIATQYSSLRDVGFQLSFLATLSLVLFATPMTERFERLMARLLLVAASLLGVTLGALPDGRLHMRFLDVGQGEAVLIVTPDSQQVLMEWGCPSSATSNNRTSTQRHAGSWAAC